MGGISGGGLSLGTLWVNVAASVDAALKEFQKFGNETKKLIDDQKKQWAGLEAVGSNLTKLGAAMTAGLTLPLVGVGAAAVKVAGDLEKAKIGFTTMLGSAEAAEQMLSDLRQFATETPFEFPELVEAAQRMKALGFEAKDVIPTLRTVGDTAAAMGKGKETIDGITTALGQMQAKGKVSAEEMMQLAERGVPAWEILAKSIGVSIPEAMKLAEKGAISASTAIPALLAGMNEKFGGSMEKLSKTLGGQWSNLKDKLVNALIPIGQVLMPALSGLLKILEPILNLVGKMATEFAKLPEPVKNFAIAMAGILAAAGPLTTGIGLAVKTFAELGPTLTKVGTSVISLGKSFGLATTLTGPWGIAIAAVAAALVVLGTWVYNNWDKVVSGIAKGIIWVIDRIDALVEIAAKIPIIGEGWKLVDKALDAAKGKLEDYAKAHEETTDRVAASWGKQATVVRRQIATINTVMDFMSDRHKATEKTMADASIETTKVLQQNVDDRKRMLADVRDAQKAGIRTIMDVRAAELALFEAEKKFAEGPTIVAKARKEAAEAIKKAAEKQAEAEKKAAAEAKKAWEQYHENHKSLRELAEQIDATGKKLGLWGQKRTEAQIAQQNTKLLNDAFGDSLTDVVSPALEKAAADAAIMKRELEGLGITFEHTPPHIYDTANALKNLGITSKEELGEMADKARENYEVMEREGTASVWELAKAHIAALEAQKDAVIAYGEIWSAQQEAELEALKRKLDQMEGRIKKSKSVFEKFGQEAARGFARAFADIGKRLIFGGDDTNRQLAEQEAELNASLAERAGEWEAYQQEVAAGQAELTAQLAEDLATEESDLADSLAGREKEYQDAVADILQQTADLAKDQADEMAAARKDAAKELDEQVRDYEEFADDVDRAIRDIGEKYADQIAEETEDLHRELRDRAEDYDDFVRDVNTKLRRIGEDTQQNIEDETQDTADNIAERTRDYNRYAEDVAADIAELRKENNGQYTKEEGDLLKSLRRRKEDLDSYVAEQNRRLDRYTRDQKENQREEEEDLSTSLADRTEDYQTFLTDRNADYDAAVAGFKEAQDKEVAEQLAALAEKKQALEIFQTEQQTQLDELALAHKTAMDTEVAQQNAALGEQKLAYETFVTDEIAESDRRKAAVKEAYESDTATLATELAAQKADYEQFVRDISGPGGELEKLKEQHRTIWKDIGDIGKEALGGIADAMLRIASEEVIGTLMNKLAGMEGILGSIGRALGGVADQVANVDKIPTTGGDTPSPGGGGGGVGGVAGGALSGWIGAISGAVTAVSSVIGNFQMAGMNKSLDLIVNHTLRTFNETFNRRADAWEQYNQTYARLGEIWRDVATTMDKTAAIATDIDLMQPDMASCARTLEAIVTGEKQVHITLTGSDPATVAQKLAAQLRLQGAFA